MTAGHRPTETYRALLTPPPAPDMAGGPLDRRPFHSQRRRGAVRASLLAERRHFICEHESPRRRPGGDASLRCRLARLIEIPSNPVPKGAVVDTLATDDGVELRYARFPPNRSPMRGTVVLLQGRTEFIEKYFEMVNDLRRRGFAVADIRLARPGGIVAAARQFAQGARARFRRPCERFRDCYAGRDPAGLSAALLRACTLHRRRHGAPFRAEAAHADRSHGAHRAATCARSHRGRALWRASRGFLMHFGLGEAFSPGTGATLMQTQPFGPKSSDERSRALPASTCSRRR